MHRRTDTNLYPLERQLTKASEPSFEGALMENELGNAPKHMKHKKTPGIDGFPSEFYKMFWEYLKSCVLKH